MTQENTTRPNRRGHSGGTGSYPLSQITTDLVHQKIMNVLRELFWGLNNSWRNWGQASQHNKM